MSADLSKIDFAINAIDETLAQLRDVRIAAERRLGIETPEQRKRRRAEDLVRERMEVEVFSGRPSPTNRLSAVRRHLFAQRRRSR